LTFLTDLAHCTKALESKRNTLDNTLPTIDWLLGQYEAGKTEYQNDLFMTASINSGWAKLDKYTTGYAGLLSIYQPDSMVDAATAASQLIEGTVIEEIELRIARHVYIVFEMERCSRVTCTH
jgi:hypothetical protein